MTLADTLYPAPACSDQDVHEVAFGYRPLRSVVHVIPTSKNNSDSPNTEAPHSSEPTTEHDLAGLNVGIAVKLIVCWGLFAKAR